MHHEGRWEENVEVIALSREIEGERPRENHPWHIQKKKATILNFLELFVVVVIMADFRSWLLVFFWWFRGGRQLDLELVRWR